MNVTGFYTIFLLSIFTIFLVYNSIYNVTLISFNFMNVLNKNAL